MDLGWVRTGNIRAVAETVAALVGSGFDETDWCAFQSQLFAGDTDHDRLVCPLAGPTRVELEFSFDPVATDVVFVRLVGETPIVGCLSEEFKILGEIVSRYEILQPNSSVENHAERSSPPPSTESADPTG